MEPIKDPMNENSEAEATENSEAAEVSDVENAAEQAETEPEVKVEPVVEAAAPAKKGAPKRPLIIAAAVAAVAIVVALIVILIPKGHTHVAGEEVKENVVPATCTVDGSYDRVIYCKDCSEEISRKETKELALGHTGGEATCLDLAECTRCGAEYGNLAAHDYEAATCTAAKTCKVCSATDGNALGHNFADNVVAPTCTETGYTLHACTNSGCTESYQDTQVDANGHSWIGERSCAADRECENCDETQPKLNHTYEVSGSVAAGCATEAKTVYECTGCGDTYDESVGSALGHNLEGVVPTEEHVSGCTYVQKYECARCGETVDGDQVERHALVATITVAATCSADGVKTTTCANGCGYSDPEPIAKNVTGHNWVIGQVSDGKRVDQCSLCGESKSVTVYTGNNTGSTNSENFKDTEIELNDANISMDEGVINSIGNKDVTLSADKLEGDDRLDLGLGSDKLAQVGDSPIYNFTINDGSQNISKFGEENFVTITLPYVLEPGEDVDNIAIWFIADNGTLESIPATYNNGYVTFKTNHFSYYTVTRLTPAERCALYGHSETKREVAATCLTDGYTLSVCARCHETKKTVTEVADGHNFVESTVPATCTASGKVTYACADCEHSYENRIPATGHKWELTASVEATCAASGSVSYSCSACAESYTETLAQKKHVMTETVVAPDCENAGYTLHECENCDYSYSDNTTAAIGHSYTVSFEWNVDYTAATANFVCASNAEHTLEIEADVEVKVIDATCSGGTVYKYTATVSYEGETYTDMQSVSEGTPNHTYGEEWKNDETSHWHECVCGAKDTVAAHDFGEGTVTKEPTCVADGVKTYTCVCGKTKTETVPATGEHNYENGVCTVCGAEGGNDCDHTVLHWDYIEFSDYGFCPGTINYRTCECGEVALFDESYCEISCDSDYYNRVVEDTENGQYATATIKCEECNFTMDMEGWMVEDGCEQSIVYNYSIYDADGEIIVMLVAEESYSQHSYDGKRYEIACGGTLSVLECKDCGEIVGLEDINVDCAGAPDFDLDLDIDDGEDQHFAYDFECADCGLCVHYVIDVIADSCKMSMSGSLYLAVGDEILMDISEEYVDEDHDFDYTYELLGGAGTTCKDGVKEIATCPDCGFSIHVTSTYHADTEEDVDIDLSEYSSHIGRVNVDRCKVCGTVTYVDEFDYDCDPIEEPTTENILDGNGTVIGMQMSFTCSCGLTFTQKTLEYNPDPCKRIESNATYVYKNGTCIFEYIKSDEWGDHEYEYEFEMKGDTCKDGVKVYRECKKCGSSYDYNTTYHETEDTEVYLSEYGLCGGYVRIDKCRACGEITNTYVNDYDCHWMYIGTEGGCDAYFCGNCLTLKYTKSTAGEKDEECYIETTYEYNYYRNEELVYSTVLTSSTIEHDYESTYEFDGTSCEDGVHVYRTCRDCGYSYDNYYKYHNVQFEAKYDLTEYGACNGYIELYSCPCGEQAWVNTDICANEWSGNRYKDENGIEHIVNVGTCRDCGLRYQNDSYVVKDVAACKQTTYYSVSITVGNTAVAMFEYTSKSDSHDYKITATLIGGAGTTCEDGVIVTKTCNTCGNSYDNEIYWHETVEVERYDISEYGSECGGYIVYRVCPCGEVCHMDYNNESFCEFESQWQECWAPNAIIGWIGDDYYSSDFYDYVCAVTDPKCGFAVRYGCYYVAEGCEAVQYRVYRLGYDEATDTYKYEIKFKTGNVLPYHDYEETSINTDSYSGYLKECKNCSATYSHKEYFYSNGFVYSVVNEYNNPSATSGYNYLYEQNDYAVDSDINYTSKSYTREVYVDGYEWVREVRRAIFRGYEFITYEYRKDGSFFETYEYEYDFSSSCKRIVRYSNSDGEAYESEESAHATRWYVIESPTCTQSGTEGTMCRICDERFETYSTSPIAHAWEYFKPKGVYVCSICMLENANGASGEVVMEDLTATYGNGENYVVGYWDRDNVSFTYYVEILVGEVPYILDGVNVYEHDSIRALVFSKAEVVAAASKLGYSEDEYVVRMVFVPYGADGSYDYAITFDEEENLERYYIGSGESVSILVEAGEYEIYSFGYGDSCVELYDLNGEWIYSDDDSGVGNNFYLTFVVPEGETYEIVVRWLNGSTSGNISVVLNEIV